MTDLTNLRIFYGIEYIKSSLLYYIGNIIVRFPFLSVLSKNLRYFLKIKKKEVRKEKKTR